MTPEALRSLIAGGETLDVEFKDEEARALSDGDLVEAVVCLANRSGNAPGWLLWAWKTTDASRAHARAMPIARIRCGSRR